MSEVRFEHRGVRCTSVPGEAHAFHYLPLKLWPQPSAGSGQAVNLVVAGSVGFLQLAVTWDAPGDVLDELRAEAARRAEVDDPRLIRLSFAPVTPGDCVVLLGDGRGTWHELARRPVAGSPPYTCIFSASVDEGAQNQVAAALNGREQFVAVRLDATVAHATELRARLRGEVADLVRELHREGRPTITRARAALGAAVDDGSVDVQVVDAVGAPLERVDLPRDVLDELRDAAVDVGAMALLDADPVGATAARTLDITTSVVHQSQEQLDVSTDVATWEGLAPPTPIGGGTGGEPTTPPRDHAEVALGFTDDGRSLAVIALRVDDRAPTAWLPPFDPISIEVPAATTALGMEVEYLGTSRPHRAAVPVPPTQRVTLSPSDAGLVAVTLDGRQLEAARCVRARVRLRYGDGPDSPDDVTAFLHQEAWVARRLLVVATDGAPEVVELSWRASTSTGQVLEHQEHITVAPEIVLTAVNGEE